MNKKSKSIKTFALALALGAALLFPVPLSAQNGFDNQGFGSASSGVPIGNQSFGGISGGGSFGNQVFGNSSDGGSLGNQTFGVFSDGSGLLGNQTFGFFSDGSGLLGNQTFGGVSGGGLLGNQTFGAIGINFSNSFNNQYFGDENTPTGSGLTILLIAGAGYAFYKKQRTNNKQKTLEK